MKTDEKVLFAGEMIPLEEGYELKLIKYKQSEIGTKYKLDEIWNKLNNKFPILKRL